MATYLGVKNGSKNDEEGYNRQYSNLFSQFGVYKFTDLTVKQNTVPNMSINVSPGDIVLPRLNYSLSGWNTTDSNVIIASNSSGQPRITSIVAYIDTTAKTADTQLTTDNPTTIQQYETSLGAVASNEQGGLKFIAINGTPATSPVAPNAAEIETVIGVSKPYMVLADITVANGATSITNANITDKRQVVSINTGIISGWSSLLDSAMVYASSSTMTGPSGVDLTEYLEVGDSISWTDNSNKIAYVIEVTSTTLTVAGATVENSAITNFIYSKIPGKIGFLNWQPVYSAADSMTYTSVTTEIAKFRVIGNVVDYMIMAVGTTGGTAGGYIAASTPIPPVAVGSATYTAHADVNDAGLKGGFAQISPATGLIIVYRYDRADFGLGTTRRLRSFGHYPISGGGSGWNPIPAPTP